MILPDGDGATTLARNLGIPEYDPTVPEVASKCEAVRNKLLALSPDTEWGAYDWRRAWNYETTLSELGLTKHDAGTDTVGCVTRE